MCIRDRCFYGCFALGALYWTLYLLLFDTTPRVFYVSEFGWVASVIFLRILPVSYTHLDMKMKNSVPQILPPAILLKSVGSVMNSSDGPEPGSTP